MGKLLMALSASVALSACAATPPPAQDYTSRAEAAEQEANIEFILNLGSAACINGINLGCMFVTAYEYCRQGSMPACADTRTYGRLLLTAAALAQ